MLMQRPLPYLRPARGRGAPVRPAGAGSISGPSGLSAIARSRSRQSRAVGKVPGGALLKRGIESFLPALPQTPSSHYPGLNLTRLLMRISRADSDPDRRQRQLEKVEQLPEKAPPKLRSRRRRRTAAEPTARQVARWKTVQAAKAKGMNISGTARELGLPRKTVRKNPPATEPPRNPPHRQAVNSRVPPPPSPSGVPRIPATDREGAARSARPPGARR